MTSESYFARISPFIRHEMDLKPYLILTQDYTPPHKAVGIMREVYRLKNQLHVLASILT